VLVFDIGTSTSKIGSNHDDGPIDIFPTILGRERDGSKTRMVGCEAKYHIGDEAHCKRGILSISHPVANSRIEDWNAIEKLWEHCFTGCLKVVSNGKSVLLSEPPKTSKNRDSFFKNTRERTTQIFFEKFEVQDFFLANKSVLAMYDKGHLSGISLDSGDGGSFAVPVYEGYGLNYATTYSSVSGIDLTNHLATLMMKRQNDKRIGCNLSEFENYKTMKDYFCKVALDYDVDMEKFNAGDFEEKGYELPDGTVIQVRNEQIMVGEALFRPELADFKNSDDEKSNYDFFGSVQQSPLLEKLGIQNILYNSYMKTCSSIRRDLLQNVVLSGGNAMLPGMKERLWNEMWSRVDPAINLGKFIKPTSSPVYASWVGGAVLSSLSSFQDMMITKSEYDENGPNIVHRKCFM